MTRADRWRALVDEILVTPMKILWSDRRARFGITICSLFVLMGTVGVWIVDIPRATDGPRLLAPFVSMEFPLGTDQVGKGIMASLIHSTPPLLKMMLAGAVFSNVMAVAWGTYAGYKGGLVDRVFMTVADIVMTIPGLPLIVVLAAIWTPESPYLVGILLSINTWAGFARSLRSQVLTIRQESYVEASRTIGLSNFRIISRDIMPNLMPLITVSFVTNARGIIFKAVGLYFIGVLPFTTVNWGVMMNLAYQDGALFNMDLAHWFVAPMFTIVLLSLGLILLGQGLDRIFNPRIRAKHDTDTNDEPRTAGGDV